LTVWPAIAAAQGAQAPLSHVDPNQAVRKPEPPPAPPLEYHPAPARAPTEDTTPRLILRQAVFDNALSVPASKLDAAWSDLRGKQVSLADLSNIGHRAEAIYAKAGYPFVAVVLRVQEVKDGVVHFNVIEGKISDLTVLGSDADARRQATAALMPIVGRTPLSLDDVNNAYELARDVPGLSLAGTLRRSTQPGGMDLVVEAKRDTWRAYVNANNDYADPVGPWGVLVGGEYYGPSRYGDETQLQVYTSVPTGRQVLVRASEQVRLNAAGTTLALAGLWGDAHPQGDISNLALADNITSLRVDVSQPLVKQPTASLVVDVALEGSNQRTLLGGESDLSNDKLRDLDVSLTAEKSGDWGRLSGSFSVHKGLGILKASRMGDADLSRVGADPQATILRWGIEGESATYKGLQLAVRVDAQQTNQILTAPDQYEAGNLTIGRGYQPGSALADSAGAIATELRLGPFNLNRKLSIQPFAFYDHVGLWNHGDVADAHWRLNSAGGGLRFNYEGRAHLEIMCAAPWEPPAPGQPVPGPTVLANLTIGLNDIFSAIHRHLEAKVAK
jgi:hemolysin activation/secretion protein